MIERVKIGVKMVSNMEHLGNILKNVKDFYFCY